MFTHNGKEYEIKYNMQRIELIEAQTSMPTMAQISKTGGYFGLNDLKLYIMYALKEKGSDVFVMPKKAEQIAKDTIENGNYTDVCAMVLEGLERDCPFFFRNA